MLHEAFLRLMCAELNIHCFLNALSVPFVILQRDRTKIELADFSFLQK